MLQLQYFNSKLSKNQIDNILNNFNIKYTTAKNEINAKLNNLVKLFLNDIQPFLENIEEISKERKKLKELENIKKEYNILSSKLKEKTLNEHKLESNIEYLQKEIKSLKNKNRHESKKKNNMKYNTPKTPSQIKNKPVRNILNKSHIKVKSDVINSEFGNKPNVNNRNKTTRNSQKNIFKTEQLPQQKTAKLLNNKSNVNVSSSVKKKFKESIFQDKNYLAETIASSKPNIINIDKNIDKAIEKIRKYNENRNNANINRIKNVRFKINKNNIRKKKKNDNFSNYKKNVEKFNKDIIAKNENIMKSMTFPKNDINLVDSIQLNDSINLKNYSEDDENSHSSKRSSRSRSSSLSKSRSSSSSSKSNSNSYSKSKSRSRNRSSVSSDNDSVRSDNSIDNEIKELEEDENNILMLIKEIKELSTTVN